MLQEGGAQPRLIIRAAQVALSALVDAVLRLTGDLRSAHVRRLNAERDCEHAKQAEAVQQEACKRAAEELLVLVSCCYVH